MSALRARAKSILNPHSAKSNGGGEAVSTEVRPDSQRSSQKTSSDKSEKKRSTEDVEEEREAERRAKVGRALALLIELHHGAMARQEQQKLVGATWNFSASDLRTLYGLMDVLAMKGIVPSLSPGVAIPAQYRMESEIDSKAAAQQSYSRDLMLLSAVIDGLSEIAMDQTVGIAPMLRDRMLTDIIAGNAELAFAPDTLPEAQRKHQVDLQKLLNDTLTSQLLPLLATLLQPGTPDWLRSKLAENMSVIPLRPHGVRTIIDFVASSIPQTPSSTDGDQPAKPSQGPMISHEAMVQSAKLLSSVPSTMTAEEYFRSLAPQLLLLLDGRDGPEMKKVAAYIIGSGILGRKSVGAPGKVGWKTFAEPMLNCINPAEGTSIRSSLKRDSDDLTLPIIPEAHLRLALERLSTLVRSHPNPGLTSRLLGSLLLPLWGLLNYARSTRKAPFWFETPWFLLDTFYKLSAGLPQLRVLCSNLRWEGPTHWTYGPGSEGGVELRRRTPNGQDVSDMLKSMAQIDQRVNALMDLLASGCIDDGTIGMLLAEVTKDWLLPNLSSVRPQLVVEEPDPFQPLVNAKLVQRMLEQFKDKLAADPIQVIQLAKVLLEEYIEVERAQGKRRGSLGSPTSAGISNIVPQESLPGLANGMATTSEEDSVDLVSIAISVLTTVISSEDYRATPETTQLLRSIFPSVRYFCTGGHRSIPASLTQSARNLITLIESSLTASADKSSSPSSDPHLRDRQTHATAMNNLTSPSPPVRAEALHNMHNLINANSPIVDIPATAVLLISIVGTDPEEFVYLNAIKTLTALAFREPRMVTRLILDAYADPDEKALEEGGLDGRLRVGEAIMRIVEGYAMAEGNINPIRMGPIRMIINSAITVAGRRGQKQKTADVRAKAAQLEEMKRRESDALRDPRFSFDMGQDRLAPDGDEQQEGMTPEHEALERIVKGWEDTGVEEDVRIRASALSILGRVLESALDAFTPEMTATATDLALFTLAFEPQPEKAIVRRAAVLVILSLLRAMDASAGVAVDLDPRRWQDVEMGMKWVSDMDEDLMVRGHAKEVLDGLEAWRLKVLMGKGGDEYDLAPRFNLPEGKLKGLNVDPGVNGGNMRPGRPMVVEVEQGGAF